MKDLSQQALLEQIEALKKELAASKHQNELIPGYLAGMSHDIRTPLNAILGFSGLLADQDLAPDELTFYSSMIVRSSKKLLNTVNNLIDFAKIETDNLRLLNEKVIISELFQELKEEMEEEQFLFGKENVNLHFHAPRNGLGTIVTDKAKLHQVLKIFLDNSLKFTTSGEIEVVSQLEGGTVGFSVRDTGQGMDTKTLGNIFNIFPAQNIGDGAKLKTRGLGMAVANKLVHLLDGELLINSKLKVGTTVSVSLPN